MNITAENQFTPWVRPSLSSGDGIDVSIENPNGATVTVQRSLDSGTTFADIVSYTVATETSFAASSSTMFRVGVKTGGFGTASFNVRIAG